MAMPVTLNDLLDLILGVLRRITRNTLTFFGSSFFCSEVSIAKQFANKENIDAVLDNVRTKRAHLREVWR